MIFSKRAGLALPVLVLMGACAIPTDAPIWDMTWNIPGQEMTIDVDNILPPGVSAQPGGTTFRVDVDPVQITRTLGQDCSVCQANAGATIPKPAFVGLGTGTSSLPSEVVAATLAAGNTLTVTVNNGYNFDALRTPSFGYLVITVRSGGVIVGKDSVNGAQHAMPASTNAALVRAIPLTGNVSGPITVATELSSPLGGPTLMQPALSMNFTASVGNLLITSATVNLVNQAIAPTDPSNFDLSGMGDVTDRVEDGSILLTMSNPFAITGNLQLTLAPASGAPIVKQVALAGGTTNPSVNFSKSELRAIMGEEVKMSFSGLINGNNVAVTPGQTISVASRLQITIRTEKTD